MRVYEYSGRPWLALLMLGLGLWLLVREVFGLGPWFGPATLGALAAYFAFLYIRRERRLEWLVAAWLLGMWALYLALGIVLGGPLPFAFFFVLLGLGFMGVYATGTRPATWPVMAASALFALGTIVWVLGIGLALLPYVLPLVLIGYGIWLLRRENRQRW
ncbi:hypothetical protein [Caldinitratiruptor microaerophilus]|uniref:Uncharacterized protein n=1 Tax=Caldinitratiruptor microaerophilus TaxID=671077 RepID=A0AA35CQG8_9FIRM|nr:hypothetical protein [Caldinitratiruptor microaerophilus]BDG62292.1 hypothetical protein caldi_33820 [Caldinitratiruptor microaerophilus]